MKKIEDIYKDYNEKIIPSKKLDEKVLNETIYKKSYNSLWKKSIITFSILLIIIITTIGIVYADEIKQVVKKYFLTSVKVHTSNDKIKVADKKFVEVHALKELKYDADLPVVEGKRMNFENKPTILLSELEAKLQIKFLHFKEDDNQKIIIVGIEKVDNKIASADFESSIKASNNSIISIQMQLATKYTEQYKNGFSIQLHNSRHGADLLLTEHSEKLDTDIYYIVGTTYKEDYENRLTFVEAVFIYDDVAYRLLGNNISKNILTNIIESVSLN